MNHRQDRLAAIEDHLGVNGDPCGVCGHKAGSVRCERPEDVEHMAMTEKMRWTLDELGVDWE